MDVSLLTKDQYNQPEQSPEAIASLITSITDRITGTHANLVAIQTEGYSATFHKKDNIRELAGKLISVNQNITDMMQLIQILSVINLRNTIENHRLLNSLKQFYENDEKGHNVILKAAHDILEAGMEITAETDRKIDENSGEIKNLKSLYGSLHTTVEGNYTTLTDQIASLHKMTKETNDKIKNYQNRLESLSAEINHKNTSVNQQLRSISSDNSALKTKVDKLEKTYSDIHGLNNKISENITKAERAQKLSEENARKIHLISDNNSQEFKYMMNTIQKQISQISEKIKPKEPQPDTVENTNGNLKLTGLIGAIAGGLVALLVNLLF